VPYIVLLIGWWIAFSANNQHRQTTVRVYKRNANNTDRWMTNRWMTDQWMTDRSCFAAACINCCWSSLSLPLLPFWSASIADAADAPVVATRCCSWSRGGPIVVVVIVAAVSLLLQSVSIAVRCCYSLCCCFPAVEDDRSMLFRCWGFSFLYVVLRRFLYVTMFSMLQRNSIFLVFTNSS